MTVPPSSPQVSRGSGFPEPSGCHWTSINQGIKITIVTFQLTGHVEQAVCGSTPAFKHSFGRYFYDVRHEIPHEYDLYLKRSFLHFQLNFYIQNCTKVLRQPKEIIFK